MEAFGGHASRPASLGVASRGNELLSPVRQTGQPTQQTTVPAAQQHSPAHAVPVVVQAVSTRSRASRVCLISVLYVDGVGGGPV